MSYIYLLYLSVKKGLKKFFEKIKIFSEKVLTKFETHAIMTKLSATWPRGSVG